MYLCTHAVLIVTNLSVFLGDGMNAFMVYKVSTKVRPASDCVLRCCGSSVRLTWLCVCRPVCPYSAETRSPSRGASVIFWVCTVNSPPSTCTSATSSLLRLRRALWVSPYSRDVSWWRQIDDDVCFSGMTKVKVGKEDLSSVEFVERRRSALER